MDFIDGNAANLLRDDDSLLRQIFFGVLRCVALPTYPTCQKHDVIQVGPDWLMASIPRITLPFFMKHHDFGRCMAGISLSSGDLGFLCRHHHPNLASKVDVIYALSQAWCNSNSDTDFELLEKYLSSLKPEESILVASSFSHM